MGKLLERLGQELVRIIGEEVDDEEFSEALEVEALFGEAMAMGATSYDVPAPTFNSLDKAMGTAAGLKAQKKGYVDVDLIGDLKQWRSSAEQELSSIIGDMLWKRSKVYIKDQRDFFKAIGISPQRLGQMIKDSILREWHSLGNIGLERDEEEGEAWLQAVRAGEKARVTIRPVKGKGASGWAVEMKPAPRTILRALDLSESWAYLAKTVLNESILDEGDLAERKMPPKLIVELFSKATEVSIDPKKGRMLGMAFTRAFRKVLGQTITFDDYNSGDIEVTNEKEWDIGGEAEIETSRSLDPQMSRPVSVDYDGNVTTATEIMVSDSPSIGIPSVVVEMKPLLIKMVGQEGYAKAQKNLARVILANSKARKLMEAAITEYVKTMEVNPDWFSDELTDRMTDSQEGMISMVGLDMGWEFSLKRVNVKLRRGAVAARGRGVGAGSDIMIDLDVYYSVTSDDPNDHYEVDVDELMAQGQREYDDWLVGQYAD